MSSKASYFDRYNELFGVARLAAEKAVVVLAAGNTAVVISEDSLRFWSELADWSHNLM